ncbi:MAG: hypothetical protein POELPBGB_02439 [Bacteroidia bacterium]|nr:hypothetical protein [Bacteroidia bacterium]
MKTTHTLWLLAASATLLISCSAKKHLAYEQYVTKTPLLQAPMIAELDVDLTKKVSANVRCYKSNEENAKQAALYDAMKNSGCDVVVHPVYEIIFGKKVIEVTVSGYYGKYKNIRKPNLEDVTLMQELQDAQLLWNPNAPVIEKTIFKK